MKRFCALALVLLLLLSACGKQQEPEPTVETQPSETVMETAAATEDVQAKPVVITKDPTDEYLEYNWKTWFVAHADNATSVTWEFISPDGVIHSVNETVEMNPNLFLDVSKGDTVALEHAPLSLNGWSVQARYEGPGGTATTNPAHITVKQTIGAYDVILEKYQKAADARDQGVTILATHDVSEMIFYADHVGYLLKDLDGNGVEELILAGIGYDVPEEPVIFDIYTIQNSTAVNVARSYARSRLFLMKDGKIYNEGSSGASSNNFSVMKVSGAELVFNDGLYTTAGQDDSLAYFYTTDNQFGDPGKAANDNAMDEKVAQTFLDTWRSAIELPNLCYIA